jgi:hypothetical protein
VIVSSVGADVKEKVKKPKLCPNCDAPVVSGQPCCLITGVKLQVIKPLSESWDSLGATLRLQRALQDRVLNAVILGLHHNLEDPTGFR